MGRAIRGFFLIVDSVFIINNAMTLITLFLMAHAKAQRGAKKLLITHCY